MERKAVSGIMLTLLLTGMLMLAFDIQLVRASETIYIRADGSVDPSTAPIHRDGDVYTFTDNIYDSIVVERDNIVVDGAGYTLQGTGTRTAIYMSGRNNITIKNMEIKAFWDGIYLKDSSNNIISGNNITANVAWGIWLDESSNNIISGNNITANSTGIWLDESSNNIISGNNIRDNEIYGIDIFWHSKYNNISGNNITNSENGIWLSSSNNNISGNIMTNNWIDILLQSSSNNISGNTMINNTYAGILLHGSSNNISSNTMTNTYVGIWLGFSKYNSISENNITKSDWGVLLKWSSNYNSIYGNNITNCWKGLVLIYSTDNNTIYGNNIANNDHGIYLNGTSNNMFFHNNIVNNIQQVVSYDSTNLWHNGYPSGGNYWSDYTDEDLFSGPYQSITGNDGVWDHPYEIDAENIDNYPLVEPWIPLPEIIDELKTEIEEFGLEGEIDNRGIVRSLIAKLNAAQKLVYRRKTDEAKTVLEGFITQVQELSGTHITPEAAEILVKSAEYIMSHL